jgi:hypothetical protein
MKYMGCKQCNKKMKIFKWQYIQNFFRFLIANVKSGFKQVSYSEYEMRRAICRGCMFYDVAADRCKSCGCWIHNKARWKSEDCPENFWKQRIIAKVIGK